MSSNIMNKNSAENTNISNHNSSQPMYDDVMPETDDITASAHMQAKQHQYSHVTLMEEAGVYSNGDVDVDGEYAFG